LKIGPLFASGTSIVAVQITVSVTSSDHLLRGSSSSVCRQIRDTKQHSCAVR